MQTVRFLDLLIWKGKSFWYEHLSYLLLTSETYA